MCGICGIVHDDETRPLDIEALQRMNDALRHRGPDDEGSWSGSGAGLAMRRLKVIDLEGGRQPMLSDNGGFVLVFNGELYNFRELRLELEAHGYVFRTQSDTEVVLRAFEHFGDGALGRFNGMFALALYDTARRRLVLARDRLGIKPLYYAHLAGTVVFASELDALMQSGLVPEAIAPNAVRDYFTYLYIPAPDTIYRDVHKLRPAEIRTFERGVSRTDRYWRLEYAIDPSWSLDSASERFLELLTDAVRLQRSSDVPLGAFLSGGMDSSTVVSALARLSTERIKTFTIGFDDVHADELAYARLVADHVGSDHTEAILHPELTAVLPALVRHFGEPFADSSALPTWLVSRMAREQVTVALSGDGGDELFAGYTWTRMNRDVAAYRKAPAFLRRGIDSALFFAPRGPRVGKLRRFSADAFMEPFKSFKRRHTCFTDEQRAALFSAEWRAKTQSHYTDRFAGHGSEAGDISPQDWMLYQDTMMYLPDDILTKVDRMSMAHGLEARVPLLDHRIVEFAATVPFDLKLRGRTSKRLLKHAMRGLLPPKLLKQRKQGFAIPIHRWMARDVADHFEALVLEGDSRCASVVDVGYVRKLFEEHRAGRERYGHHLWAVLVFEHWMRYAQDRGPIRADGAMVRP